MVSQIADLKPWHHSFTKAAAPGWCIVYTQCALKIPKKKSRFSSLCYVYLKNNASTILNNTILIFFQHKNWKAKIKTVNKCSTLLLFYKNYCTIFPCLDYCDPAWSLDGFELQPTTGGRAKWAVFMSLAKKTSTLGYYGCRESWNKHSSSFCGFKKYYTFFIFETK